MATQNGTDIVLKLDGERIAALTTNSLNLTAAMRDVTNKESDGYKEHEYGLREGSASGTGLILNSSKNLINFSEELLNYSWVYDTDTAPELDTDLKGLKRAVTADYALASNATQTLSATVAPTNVITVSVYVKGSGEYDLFLSDGVGGSSQTFIASSEWQRVQVSYTRVSGRIVFSIFCINDGTLTFCFPQVEIAPSATAYVPSRKLWITLAEAIENKTKFDIEVTDQKTTKLTAEGLISNFSIEAPMEDNATFTAELSFTNIIAATEI